MKPRTVTASWLLLALVVAWAVASLVAASDFGLLGLPFLTTAVGMLLVVPALLVVGILAFRDSSPRRAALPVVTVCALLVVATFAVSATGLPQSARFAMSRSAFEAAARRVRAGGTLATPTALGFIDVLGVERRDGAVEFLVARPLPYRLYLVSSSARPTSLATDSRGVDSLAPGWWEVTTF